MTNLTTCDDKIRDEIIYVADNNIVFFQGRFCLSQAEDLATHHAPDFRPHNQTFCAPSTST